MIGDRLEARLRVDPDGDPRHRIGLVWGHLGTAPAQRIQRPTLVSLRPVGALLVAVLLIGFGIVVRPIINPPAATPPPSPSPTPRPSVDASQIKAVVDPWMTRFGPTDGPPISVSIIGPDGVGASYTAGTLPASPPEASTGRLGEVARVYLAAAFATIDACAQTNVFLCAKPITTTMRLDDPVAKWWPPWPAGDQTTIRRLLEGTSGLAPVSPSLTDLAASFKAGNGAALLDAAVAAPRRFAPGSTHSPVDTEWLILSAIIPVAAGEPAENMIPTAGSPPFSTRFANQPPDGLMGGSRANGEAIADIDPALLDFIGNAGGMSASSQDLADMALQTWATTGQLDIASVNYLTDAADGRRYPVGAEGLCPCSGATSQTHLLVRQIGHGLGWSSIIAYSWEQKAAIGVVLGRDWRQDDLDALLHDLLTITPG